MASVDSIKDSIVKISERLKSSKVDKISKWHKLVSEVDVALTEEHDGSKKYENMSKLVIDNEYIDDNTKYSLVCIFDSMATDEKKHFGTLQQVAAILEEYDFGETDKTPKVKKSSHQFKIEKLNKDRQIAFGFCLFATDADGNVVVDLQGDTVTPEELENIAYNYVKNHRDVGQLHMTSGEGCVVESFVTTPDKFKAMGLDVKAPIAWWVGLYIEDPEVWAKVKSGEYRAFSIEGEAERVEVDHEN